MIRKMIKFIKNPDEEILGVCAFFVSFGIVIAALLFIVVSMKTAYQDGEINKERASISDIKEDQEYVFHIKVTLSDSSCYEFEFYSSYPYRSITEMKQKANRKKEEEFVEFCYRKEHITLNRNQIMSVTMQREPTGLGKVDLQNENR